MTARVTEDDWQPLPSALPAVVDAAKVYIIPIRTAERPNAEAAADLCFPDNVRYLPKAARAAGAPVEFSQPEGARRYLQEFSIDPDTWSLGLAVLTIVNDWLIFTVGLFIAQRADQQGWPSEEAERLPLRVCVAETETGRNYQIEGSGSDVIKALTALQRDASRDDGWQGDAGQGAPNI